MEPETIEPKLKQRRGRGRPATGRSTTLVRVPVELEAAVKRWTADYRRARDLAHRGIARDELRD